jgi:hypothetical protein
MPKLKVYEAEIDGLHQWVVAAPNQRAALDAFGVHQDLFAQGLARVSEDPDAQRAIEEPGVPLRRAKGSSAAFKPADAGGADVWAQAAAAVGGGDKKAKAKKPPPSRAKLDKAEAALEEFDQRSSRELEEISHARAALEAREGRLREAQAAKREQLSKAVEEARADFRAAGGRP